MNYNFYTSVSRQGNSILYRGYNQSGARIKKKIKYEPTLFLPTKDDYGWKSLHGNNVRPKKFSSMSEAYDAAKMYEGVENSAIHGMQNYTFAYINERFPGTIKFNEKFINVTAFDIEVKSDDGFPSPDEAKSPVISIALKSNKSSIWRIWGLVDYDIKKSYMKDATIIYTKCKDERELLLSFLNYWCNEENIPDVVTGWNIRFFDIPYIVNRMTKVLGEKLVKKLSPWGKIFQQHVQFKGGKTNEAYVLDGIEIIDYQDIFTKFGYSYGNLESYKLDNVAYVVLGENKLSYEEYGNLTNLYNENPQKFIDYNLKDVELIFRLEETTGLLSLVFAMAYRGGVNYTDTLGTTAIWDSIIHRALFAKKVAIPPKEDKMKHSYQGAFVKPPIPGRYNWVVSFDVGSLYPSLIVQYNMSPETIRVEPGHATDAEWYIKNTKQIVSEYCVAANGSVYDRSFQGILPEIISSYYADRKAVKKEMLKVEQDYVKNKSKDLESEKNRLNNQQMALKILLNSVYGACANQYFRYFDMRIAEGITLSGQHIIQHAFNVINDFLNKVLKTDNVDYVIAGDTDSVYIRMDELVNKFKPKNPVKFLDEICSTTITNLFKETYDDIAKRHNAFENRIVLEREVIADTGIWTAKKRYILNVLNSEGVQYEKPKIKITGIEAIKSSTPEVCRKALRDIFPIVLLGTETDMQKHVSEFKDKFFSCGVHEISFPRGVNGLTEYYHPKTIYRKGCPINSRAALLYNHLIKEHKLDKKYETIKEGEKIKWTYLKLPNPTKENVIAFPDYLPKELDLDKYVDYNLQFEKAFIKPLSLITNVIGWDTEPTASLEDFFG